jgi:hypothetical protein
MFFFLLTNPLMDRVQDDNSETRDVVVAPDTIFGEFDISTLQVKSYFDVS